MAKDLVPNPVPNASTSAALAALSQLWYWFAPQGLGIPPRIAGRAMLSSAAYTLPVFPILEAHSTLVIHLIGFLPAAKNQLVPWNQQPFRMSPKLLRSLAAEPTPFAVSQCIRPTRPSIENTAQIKAGGVRQTPGSVHPRSSDRIIRIQGRYV
ncbi:hypothetical protein BS47DRAFT_517675 [Hydnum rufescens UP504]|uniref:Uncharacterized protein n=1 Tax=Hydnum rufescens UP504 TaxID=1448309 RepID=A0A9P6AHZ7_9AGAM|nr:hypothetical protein BS47DRAFT_517675 [Hydnum rufescens UP504]